MTPKETRRNLKPSLYYVSTFWTFSDPCTHPLCQHKSSLERQQKRPFSKPIPTQSFYWRNIRMVPYVVAKKLISWQVVLFLFLPFHNGTKIFFNFLKPLQNTARSRDMLSQGVRTHGSKDFWDMYADFTWFFRDTLIFHRFYLSLEALKWLQSISFCSP